VLRRKFGAEKDEVIGRCGQLNNMELHDSYSPENIIRMIKSVTMRRAG
jgi:hypothetical protein